jgi:hypothetical protein
LEEEAGSLSLKPQFISMERFKNFQILKDLGYEIIYPFLTQDYHSKQFKINRTAFMVCNTKAFWNKFVKRLKKEALSSNPVDETVEKDISSIFQESDKVTIFYSHKRYENEFIPFQKIAHQTGMAYFDKTSHLSIHPTYGPWFSMRAIVIFDENMNLEISSTVLKIPEFLDENSLKNDVDKVLTNQFSTWKDWVKIRDRVSEMIGSNEHRFSDDQIRYHYTKDKFVLYEV